MTTKKTPFDYALWATLPMAHTSKIEGRIKMVLDTTRCRVSPCRFLLFAALTGAAAIVPLSILHPTAKAQAVPTVPAPQQRTAQQQKARRQALARVSAVHAVPGEFGAFEIAQNGQALTPQAAAALEQKLADQPNDYAAHLIDLSFKSRT